MFFIRTGPCREPYREPPTRTVKAVGFLHLIISLACIVIGSIMLSKNGKGHKRSQVHIAGSGIVIGSAIAFCGCLTLVVGINITKGCVETFIKVLHIICNGLLAVASSGMAVVFMVTKQDARESDQAYYILLTTLMGVEVCISVLASYGYRCRRYSIDGCRGVVINQPPQRHIITSQTTTAVPQHPYALPPSQAAFTYHGNGPVCTSLTTATINSTNAAYTMQATHDQAQLIDEINMQPPPYEPYESCMMPPPYEP